MIRIRMIQFAVAAVIAFMTWAYLGHKVTGALLEPTNNWAGAADSWERGK